MLFIYVLAEQANDPTVLDKFKPFLFVAAIVVVGLFLMIKTQRRVARSQGKSKLSVKERVAQKLPGHDIYSQIGELMARLADLSRQINGQIDTRIAKLEVLLRQADRTIAKLEKLAGKTGSETQNDATAAAQNAAGEAIERIAKQFRDHDRQPKPTADPDQPSETDQNKPGNSAETQQILALAQQGASAVAISQKLNRPVGEIELIIALHDKKNSPDRKDS